MQKRMCVPEGNGKTPGDKFEDALKTILRVPKDKAAEIRHHVPKLEGKNIMLTATIAELSEEAERLGNALNPNTLRTGMRLPVQISHVTDGRIHLTADPVVILSAEVCVDIIVIEHPRLGVLSYGA